MKYKAKINIPMKTHIWICIFKVGCLEEVDEC